MSAPDTNLSTQEKRHKPALSVLRLSMAMVGLLLLLFVGWLVLSADAPQGAETQVQPGVGTVPAD
ncbi:hypothetical protein [Tropicibacter oceani]|uniref:Uncharacterized protein n=1 Tax=Tropicibacter oceani TaxID=3058420 RepID=A0ABY8QF81_9RHOB|nr:hypothetical protein [Tropicibacter oceani]WGW03274.1 hypothetical protein QF118_15275 [Tropicibacter oceani]